MDKKAPYRWRFLGWVHDEDMALQANRARCFDPSQGRWLAEDPVGFIGEVGELYRSPGDRPAPAADTAPADGQP